MSIFSNSLAGETSPYLLQHAHNPVAWYPWGEEALQLAKKLDKPILVSIGYAACHWCHVMEKESFENEATALLMNKHFVNIKIDREERPDLDHIYMDAVQAMVGNGGWPLNVFLTTEAKPFFGGTYFPPVQAYGRLSWTEVLENITAAWQNRRDEIEAQANQLIAHLQKANAIPVPSSILGNAEPGEFTKLDCETMATLMLGVADETWGGFGKPPKFLQTQAIQFLMQHAQIFNNPLAKKHALFTLGKMLNGGIYDQIGGGISRYSTDEEWRIPHFEKMLYDNALLLSTMSEAYQLSGDEFYKDRMAHTMNFLLKEMKCAEGGYYAALDADSEGVEGQFYIWSKQEILQILGNDGERYCRWYNVNIEGNMPDEHAAWKGKNVLHNTLSLDSFLLAEDIGAQEWEVIRLRCNQLLLQQRNVRIRPATDDKILFGSNGLLLRAFASAFSATLDEQYLDAAENLYAFIEATFKNDDDYYHTVSKGSGKYNAFLDDYAYYIEACLKLQEITTDDKYLHKAIELADYTLQNFKDSNAALLCYTQEKQKDVVIRKVDMHDGATPSANAIMAYNLLYLGSLLDNNIYLTRAKQMFQSMKPAITKYPTSFAAWGIGYQVMASGPVEIVVTGSGSQKLHHEILKQYIPQKILQVSRNAGIWPLLAGKDFTTQPLAYVCKNQSCAAPVQTIDEVLTLASNNFS